MSEVQIRQQFAASPEQVFEALSDHAGISRWLGIKVTVPVPTPRGGVGTVRRVHAGPTRIDEEVIEHEPPHRMVYTVVAGLPGIRNHRGEVTVEPTADGGSQVCWRVRIDSPIPGYATVLTSSAKLGLVRGLKRLSSQL